MRAEKLENPEDYVPAILQRAKEKYIQKTYVVFHVCHYSIDTDWLLILILCCCDLPIYRYGIRSWTDATDFLEKLGRKKGKLLKGGEPNTAMMVRPIVVNCYSSNQ